MGFTSNKVYNHVYMVFIDASGHSNIVKHNPRNLATDGFDLLENRIRSRMENVSRKYNCEISNVWSWLGDGGMFAFYDDDESCALNTVLAFVHQIVNHDLPILRLEFDSLGIEGELHLRIAIHKGTISYTSDGQQGSIHSSDINWGAHLEKVTPKDSFAISKDIYDILTSEQRKKFVYVGEFEERKIYISKGENPNKKEIVMEWISAQGFAKMERIQCYHERLSQNDKAALIRSAKCKVIDFGTTLNTCSGYLSSTERPVPYRDAVQELLDAGGSFCCYMIKPGSIASRQLQELRNEDTEKKLARTSERFQSFKDKNRNKKFSVFQMSNNPNMAAMFFDPDSDDAVCLFSPYMNTLADSQMGTGRADMPHYIVTKKQPEIYNFVWNLVKSYIDQAEQFL